MRLRKLGPVSALAAGLLAGGCATSSLTGRSGWVRSIGTVGIPYSGVKIPATVTLYRPDDGAGAVYEDHKCLTVMDMVRFQPGLWDSTQKLLESAFTKVLPWDRTAGADLGVSVEAAPAVDPVNFRFALWDMEDRTILFQYARTQTEPEATCLVAVGRATRLKNAWAREIEQSLRGVADRLKAERDVIAAFPEAKAKARADEAAGDEATGQGAADKALDLYLSAMKGRAYDSRSFGRVLDKALPLLPKILARGVPEEAQKRTVIARTKFQDAQDKEGLTAAAEAYKKAIETAPWWANLYFNLGVVQEKAEDYRGAAQSYHRYLAAAPGAADADEIRKKAWAMEAKIK